MRIFLILFSTLILAGCISSQQANQRITAWDTVSLSDLVNAWGVPSKEQQIASRKFYIWNNKDNSTTPAIGISAGSFGGHGGISISTLLAGGNEENFCSRVVEVNEQGQVIDIQWSGKPGLCFELTPERLIQ